MITPQMTTPEKIKALYDAVSEYFQIDDSIHNAVQGLAVDLKMYQAIKDIDEGIYNPNLTFEPQWLPLSEAPKDSRLVECKWLEFDGEEKRFFLYWNHVYKEWGASSLENGLFHRFHGSDLSHIKYREVAQ